MEVSKVGEGLHRSRQRRVGAPYPAARAGIGAASASKPRCRAIKVAEHSHIGRFPIWRQRDPVAAHKAIRDDAHAASPLVRLPLTLVVLSLCIHVLSFLFLGIWSISTLSSALALQLCTHPSSLTHPQALPLDFVTQPTA